MAVGGIEPPSPRLTVRRSTTRPPLPTYWCHMCCLRFRRTEQRPVIPSACHLQSNYPAEIWGNTRDTRMWTRPVYDGSKRRTHLRQLSFKVRSIILLEVWLTTYIIDWKIVYWLRDWINRCFGVPLNLVSKDIGVIEVAKSSVIIILVSLSYVIHVMLSCCVCLSLHTNDWSVLLVLVMQKDRNTRAL